VLHQLSGSTIDGASYTLDAAGNRTSKTDQRAAVTSNYTYDAIYQLTQVTQANNTTESYSYDAVGNRTASLGVSTYTTNASNELTATSNASYTYDNNGNTLTKSVGSNTTTYAWDFENRLSAVTLPGTGGTVTFKYDPLGRRIYKSSSAVTSIFAYDGDNLVEETNSSGTVVARYAQTQNIDEPMAMLRSGATSYYHADGLGSVTSLSNTAGALAQTYTLDSFGNQTASSGSITSPFQYTGRESDPETGLYYYRARYYDQATGRFIIEDPLGFQGSDTNFYRSVGNRATAFTDPFGLVAIDPTFNSDCLPALKRALEIVRKVALSNKACNCAYKQIGSGRSLSDLLDDPNIKIVSVPHDKYLRDANGNIISAQASYVFPYDTSHIFIRPWSCRMGRWTLAADLVHELVHLTKGSLPGDDEQLPEDMEILCGVTKPQMNFTR